jgi:hypothetical protein
MNKKLYLVDIRLKQKNLDLTLYIDNENYEIISLTPYSSFLLDELKYKYITYHNLISVEEFHDKVISKYKTYEVLFNKYRDLNYIFRIFAFVITQEEYIYHLKMYLLSKENFDIEYITDSNPISNPMNINYLFNSYIFNLDNINIHLLSKINRKFYRKNNILNKYLLFKNKKNVIRKFVNRYITKKTSSFAYDNIHLGDFFDLISPVTVINQIEKNSLDEILIILDDTLKANVDNLFYEEFKIILNKFKHNLLIFNKDIIKVSPFVYLSNNNVFLETLLYKNNNISRIFMQHGCYLYSHFFLKYNEIDVADINFVFNEYTKNSFMQHKSTRIEVIESINFNYQIIEAEKQFDFLYITHCTTYGHSAVYIDGDESYYSADANDIYQRHKQIIQLFGTKFKDKKICIKIQPGIMTGTMFYVPFLELSKNYPNVTIEFSLPIQKLISESKYIISDYFSSDFINRELHYKRDIILFNSTPLILPEETIEDMKKMFILVNTVEDLEEKVKNIENITKDRPRYDDIIEYYSSKKCDTKKVVTEILEKEFNARN